MFIVPAPSLVTLSNISNPIRPIGSSITLTCTVELSPAVDVPLTVNAVWSGPYGVTILPNNTIMWNLTVYISTAMISSFGREQFGEYSCNTSISATSPKTFLLSSATVTGTARITVGKATKLLMSLIMYTHPLNNALRCLPISKG